MVRPQCDCYSTSDFSLPMYGRVCDAVKQTTPPVYPDLSAVEAGKQGYDEGSFQGRVKRKDCINMAR